MNMSDYKKYEPFFGSWYITKELGQGSYGTVFEIERQELGMTYKAALKAVTIPSSKSEYKRIISEGQSKEDASEYFRGCVEELTKEIALMAQMKGQSNIVSYEDHQVIEHTDDVGWDIFIRMELLTPLDDYIQQHSFTEQEVIKLGIDLCKALEICQKHKIIHRDVKPENIFISSTGDYKLGDFGIARVAEKTTGASTRVGTNAYMAPEVYRGDRYNSNVDIYSLGLVMYRLMNRNRLPFYPPAPQPINFQQREEALTKRISGAELPNPVDADWRLAEIIRKACAFDAEKRYESPVDMRMQLESLNNPSSVTNRPRKQEQPTIKKENQYESRPHSSAKEGRVKQSYSIPTAVVCPQCGMVNPIENGRCENCGYALPQYSDMNARKFGFLFGENGIDHYFEFVIRGSQDREYKTRTVVCPYCGELNPDTSAVCAYCGSSLWEDIDYTSENSEDLDAGDSEIDHASFENQNLSERFDTKAVLAVKIGIAVAFLLLIAVVLFLKKSDLPSTTQDAGYIQNDSSVNAEENRTEPTSLPVVNEPGQSTENTQTAEERIAGVAQWTMALCTRYAAEIRDPDTWNASGDALMRELEQDSFYQEWGFTSDVSAYSETPNGEAGINRSRIYSSIAAKQDIRNVEFPESFPYLIAVNRAASTVTVYTPDEDGRYTVPYMAMVCSYSMDTPTGLWFLPIRYSWHTQGNKYTQYTTCICDDLCFTSVPYYSQHKDDVDYNEYNYLGMVASSSKCIELSVVDAKWIFDHCPLGTPVVIYDDVNEPGPMGKPGTIYVEPTDVIYRGWDPTDPDDQNSWSDEFSTGTAIRSEAAHDDYIAEVENGFGMETINPTVLQGWSRDSTM